MYPLCVGWVNLPELTLEYNTKADPSKNDSHNTVLSELVQRSIPKKVFVLVSENFQIEYIALRGVANTSWWQVGAPCDHLYLELLLLLLL